MILIFFLSNLFAQVESTDNFIKELEMRFAPSSHLRQDFNESMPRFKHKAIIDREEILQSKVVQKTLKHLSSVQRIDDEKLFGVTESMIVRVFEKIDEHDFFYILSNDNEVRYRVKSAYVEDVKSITELYEPPRYYSEVKVHKNISPYDRDLAWLNELATGLSLNSASWFSDLVDDSNLQNGFGFMLKAQSLADMGERFRLGASINLENAKFSSSTNSINMQNISLGIVGKSRPFETNDFLWRLSAEFRYSLLGHLTQSSANSQKKINFRSTSLNLGWEKLETNALGPWSWGLNFQRDFPKLANQNQFFNQNTNETNDSFIVQLTQGLDW